MDGQEAAGSADVADHGEDEMRGDVVDERDGVKANADDSIG